MSCADSMDSSSRETLSSCVRASMRISSWSFIACRSDWMLCRRVISESTITARSAVRDAASGTPFGICLSVTLSTRPSTGSCTSKLAEPSAVITSQAWSRLHDSSHTSPEQCGCSSACRFVPCTARTLLSAQVSIVRFARTILRLPSSTQTTCMSASTVHSHSCFARAIAEWTAGAPGSLMFLLSASVRPASGEHSSAMRFLHAT